MKYSIKLAVLGAFLAAGVAQAATTTTVTNFEQTLSFALTATMQGPTTTNASGTIVTTAATTASVATKDMIAALGKALGTNFSSKAQLLVITPTNTDNSSYWVVRDVVNKTNVDTTVSDSFTHDKLGTVTSSKVSNGKTTGTKYRVSDLMFQPPSPSPSLSFDLRDFGTITIPTGAVSASGVGIGMVGTNQAVFKGTFSASPYKAVKVKVPTTGQ